MADAAGDPFILQRFIRAQQSVFEKVISELRAGCKRTHWMWFIFPQIAGLGSSPTARQYAISGLDEATAYLQHPVLGDRLRLCTDIVNQVEGSTIDQIFGYPDHLKFRSCVTLFDAVTPDDEPFRIAIDKYFAGMPDEATLNQLRTRG